MILLPNKSPVSSAAFRITLFGAAFSASVTDCLACQEISGYLQL